MMHKAKDQEEQKIQSTWDPRSPARALEPVYFSYVFGPDVILPRPASVDPAVIHNDVSTDSSNPARRQEAEKVCPCDKR